MIPATPPDSDSIAEEPVAELLARLDRQLWRILWRSGMPAPDAEDVLQETLVLFVEKRGEIRRPEAWLVTTLRNQAIMYHRRRRIRQQRFVDPGDDDVEELCGTVEGGQSQVEARLSLEAVLGPLPARDETAVRLRYLEDLSTAEVARRMGYQPSSVRKIILRARRALRSALYAELARS